MNLIAIKFTKQNEVSLIKIFSVRHKALLYNKLIYKYTESNKGKISIPVEDIKKLKGKFNTIDEYLNSDKRWIKLLKFDDSNYSFGEYVSIMIKNWQNIRIILNNSKLSLTPMFNIIMSPKLERIYWQLVKKEMREQQLNMHKILKNNTLVLVIEQDIYLFKNYVKKFNQMSASDILLTFRRDFSDKFVSIVQNFLDKNLSVSEIITELDGMT